MERSTHSAISGRRVYEEKILLDNGLTIKKNWNQELVENINTQMKY